MNLSHVQVCTLPILNMSMFCLVPNAQHRDIKWDKTSILKHVEQLTVRVHSVIGILMITDVFQHATFHYKPNDFEHFF